MNIVLVMIALTLATPALAQQQQMRDAADG
jgi:hypothetical protein